MQLLVSYLRQLHQNAAHCKENSKVKQNCQEKPLHSTNKSLFPPEKRNATKISKMEIILDETLSILKQLQPDDSVESITTDSNKKRKKKKKAIYTMKVITNVTYV